jgi:hypothetical protein
MICETHYRHGKAYLDCSRSEPMTGRDDQLAPVHVHLQARVLCCWGLVLAVLTASLLPALVSAAVCPPLHLIACRHRAHAAGA